MPKSAQMQEDYGANHDFMHVRVTRKSQLMDKQIPMDILINGYRAGRLKNGESATYQVPGNRATVQAFLAVNKTKPLTLEASESDSPHISVESRMTNLIFIVGTILVVISGVLIIRTEQLVYMLIAAPPALYHSYLRFFRKDKYLIIKEVKEKDAQGEPAGQLPIR